MRYALNVVACCNLKTSTSDNIEEDSQSILKILFTQVPRSGPYYALLRSQKFDYYEYISDKVHLIHVPKLK